MLRYDSSHSDQGNDFAFVFLGTKLNAETSVPASS